MDELSAGRGQSKYSQDALASETGGVEPKKKGAPVAPSAKPSASFIQRDADGDGRISEAEYVRFFAAGFGGKDKNKDGELTPDEHAHASFSIGDKNQDGRLSPEEFSAIFKRQFNLLDKDRDGTISPDELKQ
jgi:Ca2+-binding EF-hand superfamily protein